MYKIAFIFKVIAAIGHAKALLLLLALELALKPWRCIIPMFWVILFAWISQFNIIAKVRQKINKYKDFKDNPNYKKRVFKVIVNGQNLLFFFEFNVFFGKLDCIFTSRISYLSYNLNSPFSLATYTNECNSPYILNNLQFIQFYLTMFFQININVFIQRINKFSHFKLLLYAKANSLGYLTNFEHKHRVVLMKFIFFIKRRQRDIKIRENRHFRIDLVHPKILYKVEHKIQLFYEKNIEIAGQYLYNLQQLINYPMIKQEVKQQELPYKSTAEKQKVKYQSINLEQRKILVKMVIQSKISVYKACRFLGINNSTAKVIIRRFKKHGDFAMKKTLQSYEQTKVEQSPEYFVNQSCAISNRQKTDQFGEMIQNYVANNEICLFNSLIIGGWNSFPLVSNNCPFEPSS